MAKQDKKEAPSEQDKVVNAQNKAFRMEKKIDHVAKGMVRVADNVLFPFSKRMVMNNPNDYFACLAVVFIDQTEKRRRVTLQQMDRDLDWLRRFAAVAENIMPTRSSLDPGTLLPDEQFALYNDENPATAPPYEQLELEKELHGRNVKAINAFLMDRYGYKNNRITRDKEKLIAKAVELEEARWNQVYEEKDTEEEETE